MSTGEAGIGKSRLVHALREGRARHAGAEQMWQCSAHHRSTPLYPVIRLLERLLDFEGPERPRHDELLQQAVADAGLDPAEAVPLLADLLSLRGATTSPSEPHAPRRPHREIAHPRVAARHRPGPSSPAPRRRGLHWADPTTVELLGRIIRSLPSIPVLCVLTFRREFEPPWSQRQPVLEIELGPLTSEEVRAMATAASDTALDPSICSNGSTQQPTASRCSSRRW